jgi:teichuronic acid biosynthesis glycosyltransferase TuaH
MHFAEDRLAQALVAGSPRVRRLLVADAYASAPGIAARRMAGREKQPFPDRAHTSHVRPLRLRRRDPVSLPGVRATYARYERILRRAAERRGLTRPAVITTHPILAGMGSFDWAGPVTFYAVNDWTAHLEYTPWWSAFEESNTRVRECGRAVCAVTRTIIDRIRPTGPSAVVPNGVDVGEWISPGPPPAWLEALPRPLLLYVGTLDERLHVDGVTQVAERYSSASVVLMGPVTGRASLGGLLARPNVHLRPELSREDLPGAVAAADACLLPHVSSRLTEAMSPLKLYEYLAAGRPVAGFDLAGVRGVSDRVFLVPQEGDLSSAVARALEAGPSPEPDRREFLQANSWAERHAEILRVALR